MATDGRSKAIIETSVLVNFLAVDRSDLLAAHPDYRFVVVDVVRNEVTKRQQLPRLEAALAAGQLLPDDPPEAIDLDEPATFAAMATLKLGIGEKAAIAAAKVRGFPLAMDDKRAWKRAAPFCQGIPREGTVSIVVSLIKAGHMTVAEADSLKMEWEKHSFKIKEFASFSEIIP